MAPSHLAKPGSKYGPCAKPCEHTDCDLTRRAAARVCRFCAEPIGYKVSFFTDPDGMGDALVHADCLEESVEKERQALKEARQDDDGMNMDLGISSGRHLL